jgi:signal transduction histidine kinase
MGDTLNSSKKAKEPAANEMPQAAADPHQRVQDLVEELKLRSAELEAANRELRRVSHYRSLFLARMSHELRTPLTSILGFTEILLDQELLTETQQRFCRKIRDSGIQLQMSLNQLVDLSRVEGGQSEVFLQEFSLADTVSESCRALDRFAHVRQVALDYEVGPNGATVVSDRGKLRQILYNFLAWALSRSAADQRVSLQADVTSDTQLRLQIDDFGPPITDLTRVFDPDERPGAREADINELGILIGHRLLEVLSGSVTLQNRDEGGLRILMELPARPAKA